MRKCPVCRMNFSKGEWILGKYEIRCPFCGAHLKQKFDWKIIPLIFSIVICGGLSTYHWIFKILTVASGVVLWIYICNLPYKQIDE